MFKIYVDGTLICSSKVDELALIDPVVNLEANKAGSFTFTFPTDHPFKGIIEERTSLIDVYQDSELVFEGIATETAEDFYGQISVTCEGELTFLNDSVLRQHHYSAQTPAQLLTAYIAEHNAQVDSWKQFTVGSVTVTGSATCFTNYETTMKEISDDLVDDFGGYLRVRHQNGVRYLDYLAESPNTNSQNISIGKNLIDLKSNLSTLDICTVLIPLGAKQETQVVPGLDARLTIESVNSGLDYLENAAAIASLGRIVKVKEWDDVTVASNLKTKGQNYLTNAQYANLVIEATAFDLGLATSVFEKFKVLDTVRVVSEAQGIDRNFMINKMTLNLNAPEKNTITFGEEIIQKLSAQAATVSDAIAGVDGDISAAASSAYTRAVAQATALITSAMGGYVYKTQSELYIMDTNDPQTATKVWRWNLNGLGYSSTGINGPYGLAMTMDGSIVANYINVGTLNANNGVYELNMQTGKIKMKDAEITGGSINIATSSETDDRIKLVYEPSGTNKIYETGIEPHGAYTYEQEENGTQYECDMYAGTFYFYKKPVDGEWYNSVLLEGYDQYPSLLFKNASGTNRVELSMSGDTGSLKFRDDNGTLTEQLDSNGLKCHIYLGETVQVGGTTGWSLGSSITLQKGYYIVRAESKVAGAYQYNHFGTGIAYTTTTFVNYVYSTGTGEVAYNDTVQECVSFVYIMNETTLYAAAITNTNAGLIDTVIKAMRIG